MNLDEALTVLGAFGRYQLLVYLAISVFDNLPSIMHMSIVTFIGYEPSYHCKIRPDWSTASNDTYNETEMENGWIADKCHVYRYVNSTSANSTIERIPCPYGWYYNPVPVETSIVTDWDLVCDKNVLPEASQMVFNFGVMFGAILFGFLSDKFGRKRSFIFALVSQSIVGCATAAAPNFYVFTILRFIVGALEQGVNITGFIMATELFPPKERTIAAVSHEFLWALGGAILPGWAYLFRQWRHLQIAVSLPTIFGVLLVWTIPESPVWLIAKGRIAEAETILQRAARMNKRHLPANCLHGEVGKPEVSSDKNVEATQKTYTVLDLVRTPNLRKITLCISGLWALNTMVYFGQTLNTPNLYGDVYLNFFIGQMVEIPSVIATMWFIYKVGRRWPLCLFHVFGGLVCIASPFVPAQTDGIQQPAGILIDMEANIYAEVAMQTNAEVDPVAAGGVDLTWLSVTLAMLGKFAINASFSIIYIYGPEIYPTVLRNTGAGMGSFAGRFGGILYPYINYLSKIESAGNVGRQLPLVIFGVLSIAGGFLALPLPETRNRPLPETIEDVENYEEFCNRHFRESTAFRNGEVGLEETVEMDDRQE